MKQKKYIAPQVETLEVSVEEGFAETVIRTTESIIVDSCENITTQEVNMGRWIESNEVYM